MGDQNIADLDSEQDPQAAQAELRNFSRRVLDDLQALELMLEQGVFESGVRRVGAEQEMFLIDSAGDPAAVAPEVLEQLDGDPRFTTELAKFNLEANLKPRRFTGRCLFRMEEEINKVVNAARRAAATQNADVLLTGILPTLRLEHLGLDAMTPVPRYHALNRTMTRLVGEGGFKTRIRGTDDLQVSHDNILLEACNTSFQIHFQVSPKEFAKLYNLAQLITAPVLAGGCNSPVLLQHRLWAETRVALFEQSIDMRREAQQKRGARARVRFGDRWVQRSVVEIFREDIARFRVMLASEDDEDSLATVKAGGVPSLSAIRLHNGTVYRWNRPCYGINSNGKPHLRIECRVLPAGPTALDEIANAAFFFGLMSSLGTEYGDVDKVMAFDDARANFTAAARHGLRAQFAWVGGKTRSAADLIVDHLLPLARQGLESKRIDSEDIDRYLGTLQARVESQQTGSRWVLDSLASMDAGPHSREERYRAIVADTLDHQRRSEPVHTWPPATVCKLKVDWRYNYRYVGQVMTRDLFVVRPEDLVDLAAAMMDWEHIRHVPVEDDQGQLVGLITHRDLLKLVGRTDRQGAVAVSEIMHTELETILPDATTLSAMRLMRERRLGCLPVVDKRDRLVGIVTEADLIEVAALLMEERLGEPAAEA